MQVETRGRKPSQRTVVIMTRMDRQSRVMDLSGKLSTLDACASRSYQLDKSDNEIQRIIIEGLKNIRNQFEDIGSRAAIDARIMELEAALEADLRDDEMKRQAIATIDHLHIAAQREIVRMREINRREDGLHGTQTRGAGSRPVGNMGRRLPLADSHGLDGDPVARLRQSKGPGSNRGA